MSMIQSPADLPIELQGRILQYAALGSSGHTRIHLMLLSKMAHDWISYIHYDTIIIETPTAFQSFLNVADARGILFLSVRVHALFIKVNYPDSLPLWKILLTDILPSLSRMQYLQIWDPYAMDQLIRAALIPALQALPRLSYLGIHPSFLWENNGPSYVVLPSITHLKIFDTMRPLTSLLSSIKSFPSLTHFMFPWDDFTKAGNEVGLAEALTSLKVLLIGKSQYKGEFPVGRFANVVVRSVDDIFQDSDLDRFKEVAADDGVNVWRLAEIEISGRQETRLTN
ncbi:hypothetical protein DL96DRAFT_1685968 [Flagelloscypha sp. PMI_526]|nr:hypothetical protein DL96DRAFT_1685968 [Flagelloscypha sp. PMI_526]